MALDGGKEDRGFVGVELLPDNGQSGLAGMQPDLVHAEVPATRLPKRVCSPSFEALELGMCPLSLASRDDKLWMGPVRGNGKAYVKPVTGNPLAGHQTEGEVHLL